MPSGHAHRSCASSSRCDPRLICTCRLSTGYCRPTTRVKGPYQSRPRTQSEETAMATNLHHWINGSPTEGTGGRYGEVTDPASGSVTAHVPLASVADVD